MSEPLYQFVGDDFEARVVELVTSWGALIPVMPVVMRWCSEDGFLGGADVVHPCEYLAEDDGEEFTCEIVNVSVVIVVKVDDE